MYVISPKIFEKVQKKLREQDVCNFVGGALALHSPCSRAYELDLLLPVIYESSYITIGRLPKPIMFTLNFIDAPEQQAIPLTFITK